MDWRTSTEASAEVLDQPDASLAQKVLVKGANLPTDDAMLEKLKKEGEAAEKSVELVARTA